MGVWCWLGWKGACVLPVSWPQIFFAKWFSYRMVPPISYVSVSLVLCLGSWAVGYK